ncbi:MAG: hypothetical protein AB7I79_21060 [Rhizobiaceae bacterium]
MLEPEIETMPWSEQARRDDASYRTQLEYLFANSRFYRAKLADTAFATAAQAGIRPGAAHREENPRRPRGRVSRRSRALGYAAAQRAQVEACSSLRRLR